MAAVESKQGAAALLHSAQDASDCTPVTWPWESANWRACRCKQVHVSMAPGSLHLIYCNDDEPVLLLLPTYDQGFLNWSIAANVKQTHLLFIYLFILFKIHLEFYVKVFKVKILWNICTYSYKKYIYAIILFL